MWVRWLATVRSPRNSAAADVPISAAHVGGPARLQLDAEAVRDPVDVVVVGDDLVGVDDRAVVEPVLPQLFDVARRDRGRRTRQLKRVGEERAQSGLQLSVCARGDRLGQRGVARLSRERLAVLDDSVEALVRRRDGDRDRLPLHTRQRRGAEHDRPAEPHVRVDCIGVQGVRGEDVRHLLRPRRRPNEHVAEA
jgi:hypothetical protein